MNDNIGNDDVDVKQGNQFDYVEKPVPPIKMDNDGKYRSHNLEPSEMN